ncbi:lactate 2-monooxygenase [Aliifodinibius salipaludis]|uniref:Lactate 2-monooxygenase n=1 Tax=Fodinibius salipaludis TaxID=2032627 RepID=A0A2A2GAB1_9BACT|nr:alpha-hydroxy-acid oxidizing protein [Aliifodinibius salipaludis]PAU93787.1 lactate 2-monooxygenase [Aliifodinibius salipaludis]
MASGKLFSRQRQTDIFLGSLRGKSRTISTSFDKLRDAAKKRMSKEAFAYVAGSAGGEATKISNRSDFNKWKITPSMLNDVSECNTDISLFGNHYPVPFLLAPIGVLDMAHPDADLAVAKASAGEGVPFIFSSQASVDMETCSSVMGDSPRWFQLYWSTSNDLVESFVQRAESCGCEAIVLTLDTTMLGWRPRDLDLDYLPFLRGRGIAQYTSDPIFRELMKTSLGDADEPPKLTWSSIKALIKMAKNYPGGFWSNLFSEEPRRAVKTFIECYSRPSLTWDDLSFLRSLTDLPILLKGILSPEDARKAVERNMNGIIVSNHGGRQVDGAVSAIEALPKIAAEVNGEIPILMDSGIRSGSHMFKAIALGADAVLLGRPYTYALAIAGEQGVNEIIQNYRADFELTMALSGCISVDEINTDRLQSA